MTVRVTTDKTQELQAGLAKLIGQRVVVGLVGKRREGNLTNMQLALVHEYGSPARNIPARPFLRPGIEDSKKRIGDLARVAVLAATDGHAEVVNSAMQRIGEEAVSSVKRRIATGPFVPLKPATKRRKGHGQPLIDTHQMINSITYAVRSA